MSTTPYVEEGFGILTDDQLYLDCILVKPAQTRDEDLKAIRVWVPKHPLTKSSVITCARQEVSSYGAKGKIAHLVFDLRGTGFSDGDPDDNNYQQDLYAVAAWAKERFGRINFGFLGTPTSAYGRVYVWPLRAGTVMETYYYPARHANQNPISILYLCSYGNFTITDDAICATLAENGYHVYGLDPLRYLLHASLQERLKPDDIWTDLHMLVDMLPSEAIVIGQPLSAGLALLWGAGSDRINGVIAIGKAQLGLKPKHIFHNANPYDFLLHRYTQKINPRPVAYIMLKDHPMGGEEDEFATLYQNTIDPRKVDRVEKISPDYLLGLLKWIEKNKPLSAL